MTSPTPGTPGSARIVVSTPLRGTNRLNPGPNLLPGLPAIIAALTVHNRFGLSAIKLVLIGMLLAGSGAVMFSALG